MNSQRGKNSFQKDLKRWLKDPEFKKEYEKEGIYLQIAYKIIELRHKSGLTQTQLAKKIGTSQGNIARLESALSKNFEIATLEKIARACHSQLEVSFGKP